MLIRYAYNSYRISMSYDVYRVKNVQKKIADFEHPTLWVGVMNENLSIETDFFFFRGHIFFDNIHLPPYFSIQFWWLTTLQMHHNLTEYSQSSFLLEFHGQIIESPSLWHRIMLSYFIVLSNM